MKEEQAIRIATDFVKSRPDLLADVIGPPRDVVRVPAQYRRFETADDAWVVWFPYRLPEGVLFMEPDALGIEVDGRTGEATVTMSL